MSLTITMKPTAQLLSERGMGTSGKLQTQLDSTVRRFNEPYCPFDTGAMMRTVSGVGTGLIEYTQPYARRQYYENRGTGNGGTAYGGKRGRYFFERMKADKLPIIERELKKAAGAK